MRITLLSAFAAALICGCTQTPRDMLTAGTWACKAKDESKIELSFHKDGKLTGKMSMIDPATPPAPDALAIVMELGGTWSLAGDADLTFGFGDVKLVQAKRGDQPLDPAEAEYFKQAFASTTEVKSKVSFTGGR